jgi:hypothetical protein
MASIEKAFPMEGSAIFTDDIPNGVRKEANVVMSSAGLRFAAQSTSVAFVMVCLIQVTKYGSVVNQIMEERFGNGSGFSLIKTDTVVRERGD